MESNINLLLVEDDPLLAESIRYNLQKEGIRVAGIARNLKDSVLLMRQHDIDIALIDIQLDGPEDGIATAAELTKMKWIPIIYITGNTPLELEERMQKTYPAAFLEKPIRERELAVQVKLAFLNFKADNLPSPLPHQPESVFLPTDKGHIGVKVKEIAYIEASGNQARLFLSEEGFSKMHPKKAYESILISTSMGRIFHNLSPDFYRLSRFTVINLNQISRIDSHRLFIKNDEIAIPEGKRKELMDRLVVVKSQ